MKPIQFHLRCRNCLGWPFDSAVQTGRAQANKSGGSCSGVTSYIPRLLCCQLLLINVTASPGALTQHELGHRHLPQLSSAGRVSQKKNKDSTPHLFFFPAEKQPRHAVTLVGGKLGFGSFKLPGEIFWPRQTSLIKFPFNLTYEWIRVTANTLCSNGANWSLCGLDGPSCAPHQKQPFEKPKWCCSDELSIFFFDHHLSG